MGRALTRAVVREKSLILIYISLKRDGRQHVIEVHSVLPITASLVWECSYAIFHFRFWT
jgi:hypothetical protein